MNHAETRPPGAWQTLLFAVLIAGLGSVLLAWSLVASILLIVLPSRDGSRLGRAAISGIARGFFVCAASVGMLRIDSAALEAMALEPGGLVVAANHPTMLDAFILLARLPRGVCIMKAVLLRNVFLGAGARLARYIRNDSGRGMVRAAVATLREGNHLVLFPEGTRTAVAPLGPFKPGVTLIAHLARTPIQTVLIETRSPYLTKGWPLLKVPPVPITIRVRLGQRFAPDADHRGTLGRLEAYFKHELES